MYLNAHISVFINGKPLSYINSVDIHNDSQTIGGTCDILLPLMSIQKYEADYKQPITLTEIKECQTAFPIVVKAKYDGYESESTADENGFITLFSGFVFDIFNGTPVTLKCMDWFYLFNLDTINVHFDKIKLADLIENQLLPYANNYLSTPDKIELIKPTIDMDLVNITFPLMTPGAVLSWIKTEMGFCLNMMGNKLYVNLSSNTTNTVKLNTAYNVIRADLQRPNNVFLNIKVKAWFLKENGTKDFLEIGNPQTGGAASATGGQVREIKFFNIKQPETNTPGDLYHKLAENALRGFNNLRYNGNLEMFIYPVCDLYWRVDYTDVRFSERNAIYVITAMDIKLNEQGFHRILKVAYLADSLDQALQIQSEGAITGL